MMLNTYTPALIQKRKPMHLVRPLSQVPSRFRLECGKEYDAAWDLTPGGLSLLGTNVNRE